MGYESLSIIALMGVLLFAPMEFVRVIDAPRKHRFVCRMMHPHSRSRRKRELRAKGQGKGKP